MKRECSQQAALRLAKHNFATNIFPSNESCSAITVFSTLQQVVLPIFPEPAFFRFAKMVFNSTILCIDDDIDDLAFIQEAIRLHESAFDVVEAKNGEEAINYLHRAKADGALPCLIIMDINMPKMDGKKAIQLIKADAHLRTIPLVVFTTSSNIADKRYFELYNVQYVIKPNHYAAFTKKVMEMLALHRRVN